MKVAHLCATDLDGGAARASYRLHKGLRSIGVDSFMLVGRKLSDDDTIYSTARYKLQKLINYSRSTLDSIPLLAYKNRPHTVFFPTWVPERTRLNPLIAAADIVNLHWISGGFLRPESLPGLNKPMVWRLSDMWAFTGGCHYAGECRRYENECGFCPQLGSKKRSDLSHWLWKRKQRSWRGLDLTIVAPSAWLAECAKRSLLFKNIRIEVIHNGVDVNKFKPIDKKLARELLDLPLNKKLILFGAINALNDPRKGFIHLEKALTYLSSSSCKQEIEIAIFGSSTPSRKPDLGFPIHYLGHLHDDISLYICYSAADIFVAPSIEENFSSAVLESLACGTPVVAFNIGGMPDLIEHQGNGYLAQPFDERDFAKGIAWMLEENKRQIELSLRAREKALKEFTLEMQVNSYLKLYHELLDDQRHIGEG